MQQGSDAAASLDAARADASGGAIDPRRDAQPGVDPREPVAAHAPDGHVDAAAGGEDAAPNGRDAGQAPLLALTPCPEEDAAACPSSDPLCYWEGGPGGSGSGGPEGSYSFFSGWSVCTRFCATDADCASALGRARCVASGSDRICLFDCSFGRSCPGELSCSNGDRCGFHFCECSGVGCDDPFCLPPERQP